MVLSQHNHFRSYLIGVDITREQSKDICYAIRSNEPYICQANETYERTTANPKDIDWVISGNKQPNFAGYDIVPGNNDGFKMTTRLEYLPSKDPLITSWINLGPNLRLFMINSSFRDAPAGDLYHTKTKEVLKTTTSIFIDKDNKMIFEEHRENWKDFDRVTIEPVFFLITPKDLANITILPRDDTREGTHDIFHKLKKLAKTEICFLLKYVPESQPS